MFTEHDGKFFWRNLTQLSAPSQLVWRESVLFLGTILVNFGVSQIDGVSIIDK